MLTLIKTKCQRERGVCGDVKSFDNEFEKFFAPPPLLPKRRKFHQASPLAARRIRDAPTHLRNTPLPCHPEAQSAEGSLFSQRKGGSAKLPPLTIR